jgi:uncharacterized SAM-binding protein YcdF (DUF218 family)
VANLTDLAEREDDGGQPVADRDHHRPADHDSRRRRRLISAISALVIVAALLAATARLLVFPTLNRPARADAIVALGGVRGGLSRALELSRAGYAPTLVVSTPRVDACPTQAAAGAGVRVICFRPTPFTTQGEAREIRLLAGRDHWRTVIVVARRSQATRARLRVDRCYDGRLLLAAPPMPLSAWPYNIAYEWGALVKALVWQRNC